MNTKLTIERYEPTERKTWDDLVRGARARHFMFERSYMDYHQDRFVDSSRFVYWNRRPIAVLPASRHGDEVISHGGLTFGGLISGPELTTVRALGAFDAITSALRTEGVRRLIYKPIPRLYHLAPAEEDLYALHVAGARLLARDVTAAVAPNSVLKYTDERRRAIARSAEADLSLGESDNLDEFMALLRSVLIDRHGVEPVHSASEMRLLSSSFPEAIRLHVATEADTIVAGVLIFKTPLVAHAQYLASGPRGRELHALDALIDHLLNYEYRDVWFDFGISNERDGQLNEGLLRNKEGYGARALVHDRYVLDLS